MDFSNMLNKPLRSVHLSWDKARVFFTFEDNSSRAFGVEGDCCSCSWIEHLTLPEKLREAIITSVFESNGEPWDGHLCVEDATERMNGCGHDMLQVYHHTFRTTVGDIVLEYRNDSNGYYGGYLVDA